MICELCTYLCDFGKYQNDKERDKRNYNNNKNIKLIKESEF